MKCIVHLLLIFSLFSLNAQTQFNNLQECLEYSIQNNALLKIDQLNREISQQKIKSAWAALLPQVKAFSMLDNNMELPVQLVPAQLFGGNEGEYAKLQFGTQYAASYGAEASLSLINVSNWKNVRSSTLADEIALHHLNDREMNIKEQLITSYYFVLLSREAIVLNQDLVKSGDSLLSAASIRLNNGLIEPLEFNRVKSLYLESQQQLRESEGAYVKNINALKVLCGMSERDSLILNESIAQSILQSTTPSTLTTTFEQLPMHKMLYTKNLQALEDLKRQRAKVFPELSLYARVSRQTFNNEFKIFSSDQQWFDVSVAGVRAEWNLFTGFNRQSNIRQASLQKEIAAYDLQHFSLQSQKEIEDLRINHQIAVDGIKIFIEHHQLNTASYRIAGEKYNQGIYTIDQYVNIYQEMVRSQNHYLSKVANYLVYESIVQSRNTLK